MPLSQGLLNVVLSRPCPHCQHVLERKGSFFQSASHYTCTSCAKRVAMGYQDKLKLFADHARKNPPLI
jgi:transposase-like protein